MQKFICKGKSVSDSPDLKGQGILYKNGRNYRRPLFKFKQIIINPQKPGKKPGKFSKKILY
jgi:hypothetical protein